MFVDTVDQIKGTGTIDVVGTPWIEADSSIDYMAMVISEKSSRGDSWLAAVSKVIASGMNVSQVLSTTCVISIEQTVYDVRAWLQLAVQRSRAEDTAL